MLKDTKSGRSFPDRDAVARRVRAGFVASAAMTLGDYLWQRHASRRKIQPTTSVSYATHIRVHLVSHLGHLPIDRLRVGHLQSMFDSISDRNLQIDIARCSDDVQVRTSVRGVRRTGPATMQRIRATLRKALNDAIRTHRLIEFNPAAYVELPSVQAPRARVWTSAAVRQWKETGLRPSSVMVWTPEQAGAFLDHVEDHDIVVYPIVALILHRGLRRGEALGLRESDVDLEGRTATITQQLTTVGYRPVIKIVKSYAGDRIIALGCAERRRASVELPERGRTVGPSSCVRHQAPAPTAMRKWHLSCRNGARPIPRRQRRPAGGRLFCGPVSCLTRAASSMAELWTFNPQKASLHPLLNVKHFRPDFRPRIQDDAAEYWQVRAVVTHCACQGRHYSDRNPDGAVALSDRVL